MTKLSKCILCDASPTTKAHLVGKILRDSYSEKMKERKSATVISTPDAEGEYQQKVIFRQNGLFDIRPKSLCGDCNGIWMRDLELAALPIIAKLKDNQVLTLNSEDKRHLAEWMISFAILRSEGEGAPDFDRNLARAFREKGFTSEDGLKVWLINSLKKLVDEVTVPSHSQFGNKEHGLLTIFWLENWTIIAGYGEVAEATERKIRMIEEAVVKLWPEDMDNPETELPLNNKTENVVILRVLEQFFGGYMPKKFSIPERI